MITRTILPVISQPGLAAGRGTTVGIAPTTFSMFASSSQQWHGIVWGAGPVMQLPTASDKALGSNRWGLGPTAVALTFQGPWVLGGLVDNVWAIDGGNRQTNYSVMTLQPFVNYNFKGGTHLSASPVITASWQASSANRWTVPVGLAVGQIFKILGQPINA